MALSAPFSDDEGERDDHDQSGQTGPKTSVKANSGTTVGLNIFEVYVATNGAPNG